METVKGPTTRKKNLLMKAKMLLLLAQGHLAQTEALGDLETDVTLTSVHILNESKKRNEAFPMLAPHREDMMKREEVLPAEKDL